MTNRSPDQVEAVSPAVREPGDGGRVVVASFTAYADAVRAVDALSDRGFPVHRARIVAHDLKFVEQVTGRETTGRAMMRAGLSGVVFGALFGLLFGMLAWRDPVVSGLVLAGYGALLGALVGAVVGAVGHRSTRGSRDFSSVGALHAGGYDVMVDQSHCEEARHILVSTGPTS